MEENLPQPQVPVVSVPPVQPPIPTKRLPLKWILIIALLAGIVLAGTFLIFKSQSGKQSSQSNPQAPIQPNVSATPILDETANWKTYMDEKYKFQFSYPPTVYLKISPKFPDQIFLTENDIDIEKVMEGPFALISTAIWDKNEFQKAGYPLQEKYLKSENIMVDGVNAVKVSGTISEDSEGLYLAGIYHQEIYFPINDKIIHFMFYEDPSSNIKLLDQILSTFKFTDQTNTEAKFCGGIANIECPTGYTCKLGGSYPDAGGKCVVKE
ncbi:hypothetical protein A3H81_04570 [Candidatus Daviesbacteria bacterium RIFCSPLOWO2_02_FULL_38_18]|nr:MAG: hypothetical protein A3D02_03975 [Candidatus Daviesbacteria bacterium RIFCSPHIGHO2_02_FULL_39_41]OGE27484.1 MAG: hypothetical protein A2772_02100 [Candidatus Daviesbacteria bacterium RIFCSPHIGHO2_01_FULL_38_8b]OGE45527.1 MAG: hypothetical protein A3E67_00100 [Candidatus Daviesbacteria bacterium RIFCSPHIGHO2_12_FULL_38_25]OGE68827.1 MAG: hypothetical protein A3H81_04570 [Candidatus Daviesbacteria bacterium RIFCSPLOWO2_02_FULL_38_18]OGE73254.1 MAG: hypothetical protein A3H18_04910 [Candid